MIEQVLDYIHNYFVKETYRGNFVIESGSLRVDFLKEGQFFKIEGSLLNDGVYQHPAELVDEEFEGKILSMAVPKAIIDLAEEIQGWIDKYGESMMSPYQSESFGGYSYSKGSVNNGSSKTGMVTWQSVFGTRLNAYRKIS